MKKLLVYDYPTRLFHWIFAGLFIGAFGIAKLFDDESPLFSYHMILGLTLTVTVLLRVIWGIIGTKYVRFSSFQLNPKHLMEYFKDLLTGKTKKYLGHNPASSWAAITMFVLALGLGLTGYLMSQGQKETFEDLHEILANLFLATALAHVLGILFHTIRHKEMIGLSMLSGQKESDTSEGGISQPHLLTGFVFVIVICYFAISTFKNYDPQQRTVKVFGQLLQLGENETENEKDQGKNDNDDDDD